MEDAHIIDTNLKDGISIFGVFDGHGGKEVALFVGKHYIPTLKELPSFKENDYHQAL